MHKKGEMAMEDIMTQTRQTLSVLQLYCTDDYLSIFHAHVFQNRTDSLPERRRQPETDVWYLRDDSGGMRCFYNICSAAFFSS